MIELVLHASGEEAEAVSDRLVDELGALAVAVEDGDAGTPGEQALFGEPGMPPPGQARWRHSTLRALFVDEAAATAAATLLLAGAEGTDVHLVALAPVPDEDWVRVTQAQFAPVQITPAFWIVPTWHDQPPMAERAIRLDPGLAFGTGSHPTTRMCLRWIASGAPALSAGWARVLDYGCGSGILAIAAALHGARGIDAVDIDPAAVASTRANALANHVVLAAGTPDAAQGTYPLVLANILAAPLKLLAPLLAGHVAPGGHLVLAGILERQAEELAAAYAPWLPLHLTDHEDGWILMTGQRAT